jgi:hypothetical protein
MSNDCSRTHLVLDVQVDSNSEDLSSDVSDPELLDEIGILHRQSLSDLHGSQGEYEVGYLRSRDRLVSVEMAKTCSRTRRSRTPGILTAGFIMKFRDVC